MEKSFIGEVEVYCTNMNCPVREVKVFLNVYYYHLGEKFPEQFFCPVCKKGRMEHHHIKDQGQVGEDFERDARASVYRQLYRARCRLRKVPNVMSMTTLGKNPSLAELVEEIRNPSAEGEPLCKGDQGE